MGVKTCHRGDCNNFMCARYGVGYGYICDECFEELLSLGVGTDIVAFMASDVSPNRSHATAAWDYFNAIFQLGD